MHNPSFPDKDIQGEQSALARAEALKSNEAILNASGLAILFANTQGLITHVNGAAEYLLGYAAEELVGKPWTLLHEREEILKRADGTVPPAAATQPVLFDVVVRTARQQKLPDHTEWIFIPKDGSRFEASLTMIPLLRESGEISSYAAIVRNLAPEKQLREQVAVSEQKFRLLAENISGAIYLCHNDEAFSVIYLNDHIKSITGYDKEEFLSGRIAFSSLFHPEDREMVFDTVNSGVSARTGFHIRYRLRHASGEWRWVDESGVGVYEDEKLVMLEGFLQDITRQKEAEEKLQKVAEENLRFFNNPVNLNAVADFNGILRRISPSWTNMLGWSEEELKSKPVMEFVHPDDVERTRETLRFISKSHKVHTFENRFACKDGTYRWLLWGLASDPQTKMIYASAVDISARKESEENILDSKSNLESITLQLQEQNRRLDEFAHIISHNLRAPVNNIQALINLLNDRSEITDYKLIFNKLKNVSKNLSETMNELMDTLKARTQPQAGLTEVRFKEVLDKVVQSLEGELIVAQASVTFDFNNAPMIIYSKAYMESIFQNLLTNAIKYRSPARKPMIHFRSSLADNHHQLEVTDNGQGIDMERFGHKLFGLHETFHEHQEARGVGLFLVKTQIEALGGTIAVTSEVDKGTTFTIRFN